MGFFKRMKFWKRAGNSRTGAVRGILNCVIPCIRRSPSPEKSSSSRQENNTLENCKEMTHRRIPDQYEALIQSGKAAAFSTFSYGYLI